MYKKKISGVLPVRERGLVAIKSLLKELNADDTEVLRYEIEDGKIILTPQVLIDKDQAWYWTKTWQDGEREADLEKERGQIREFSSVKELLTDLFTDDPDRDGSKP